MKAFTQRWKELVRHSQRAGDESVQAPPHFAGRVVAQAGRAGNAAPNLWLRCSFPALATSGLLLLLASLLYWHSMAPLEEGLRPPLENAIIEQISLL